MVLAVGEDQLDGGTHPHLADAAGLLDVDRVLHLEQALERDGRLLHDLLDCVGVQRPLAHWRL